MSMALGSGQHTAAIGGSNVKSILGNKASIEAMAAMAGVVQPAHVRTAGSVFGGKTHHARPMKQRAVNNIVNMAMGSQAAGTGRRRPTSPQGPPVANMLGKFGALTTANGARNSAAANLDKAVLNAKEHNKDQSMIKSSDEMLEIANNLTMKDMWAAA